MATTEPVADYLLDAMGMKNLTPFAFQADIMNGVDPSPEDITLEDGFFTKHQVKVFCYNQQVVDSLTASIKQTAAVGRGAGRRGLRDDADARATTTSPGCSPRWRPSRPPWPTAPRRSTCDRAPVLAVDKVGISFSGTTILDDVSFEVHKSEFTGLIGSNGVGKTTLLRIILGLQRPDSGEVRVLGAPLARHRRSLGYVPQKVALDPDVPVRARDLVALGLDGHRFGFGRRSKQQRELVDEILHDVDAEQFADSRVGSLSGGEQQRVLIAHALISRPRLLLLDEPLANLDPKSVQEIVGLLHRVATDHEVAILLSAHEMNALLPVMDRIVYMADGRAASGTTEEVVRSEVLSKLYGHHVDVLKLHGRVLVVVRTRRRGRRHPRPSRP